MEQYKVTGMSCAACSARVEKAVAKVPGVKFCSVSLLTNSMGVEGTADPAAIIKAVEDAGYGAMKKETSRRGAVDDGRSFRYANRSGNATFKKEVGIINWIPCCAHVRFYGTYDVGMATSRIL